MSKRSYSVKVIMTTEADLGLVKGGFKMKTKTILARPTTGLADHCTAHSNKGESKNLRIIHNIIVYTSSLKNKNLSYL